MCYAKTGIEELHSISDKLFGKQVSKNTIHGGSMEITIDKYTVIRIEDGGQHGFKLLEGWINRDGEFKPSFCKREFGAKGSKQEKVVPVSVKLGNADQMRELASALLVAADSVKQRNEEDVPF
jgi:hypothetical protein